MPLAQRLYVTEVDAVVEGADVFFPEIPSEWRVIEESAVEPDEKNKYRMRFLTYAR